MSIGIGVIGFGAISPFFIEAVASLKGVHLVAVCDIDDKKLAEFSGSVRRFSRYQDLLSDPLVDAVVVTLPNNLHVDVCVAALGHGMPVCCEKPLALSMSEVAKVQRAARSGSSVIFTAFHRRYNSNLRELAEILSDVASLIVSARVQYFEDIKEHRGQEAWYFDLDRCGGGALIDNGPNALDMARTVLGPLTFVDATIGKVCAGVKYEASVDVLAGGVPTRVELDWSHRTASARTSHCTARMEAPWPRTC